MRRRAVLPMDWVRLGLVAFLALVVVPASLGVGETGHLRGEDGPRGEEGSACAMPISGVDVPPLDAFDRLVTGLMREYEIPGGAIAVAKGGKLVLAHGIGWADADRTRPVAPNSLFRIASVSKPITAAAVLALVERGRLKLGEKALAHLAPLAPLEGESIDPRFRQITILQLLQHTAGFDRGASFDPMFQTGRIAEAVGVPSPPGPRDVVRFMLGRPLDFDPGTRYAYSNFGYCLLGRILENVTGQDYEEAVNALVLRPAGITRMQVGRTRPADRAEREVWYFPFPGQKRVGSVFTGFDERVPFPDGGFYLEAMDAHGAWIASAVDLVRFATALDGSRQPALFGPAAVARIDGTPGPKVSARSPVFYGLGWSVRPVADGANWFHGGSLPGTLTLLVRTHHNMAWAALFNSRPRENGSFRRKLDRAMWEAVGQVTEWPDHDLFAKDRPE